MGDGLWTGLPGCRARGELSALLDLGLIGCGRVAERYYLPALSRLSGIGRLAMADPLRERRELLAGRFPGAVPFASAEELLAEGDLDAVIVTSPAATHAAITTLALESGVPVLVEKPLASSLAEAEDLRVLTVASCAWVMVGFNRRYWEPMARLRQIARERRDSRPRSVRLAFRGDRRAWAAVAERGDVLDDLASHQVDLLRHLFGLEIMGVRAWWTDSGTIRLRIRLEGGLTADCVAAHTGPPQESVTVEYERERYYVRAGSERVAPAAGAVRAALDLAEAVLRRVRGRPSSLRASFARQLADFLECVRSGARPGCGVEDGLAAVRAVEAARRSLAEGGMEVAVAMVGKDPEARTNPR